MASGLTDIFSTLQQMMRAVNAISASLAAGIVVRGPLPNYAVAALPTGQGKGTIAFATNGRKPGEAAGAGTGVLVFFDGTNWISASSGATVTV